MAENVQPGNLQAALENHERNKRTTDIPLFYGNPALDKISPLDLIERIEAAAKVPADTTQHQKARAIAGALLQRLQQCFGKTGIQCVGALRPVQRELAKTVLLLNPQRCG